MTDQTTSRTINRLRSLQYAKLRGLVEAMYATKRMTDTAFAPWATEQLGFAVSASQVAYARSYPGEVQIPSTGEALAAERQSQRQQQELFERQQAKKAAAQPQARPADVDPIATLESRMTGVEGGLRKLMAALGVEP